LSQFSANQAGIQALFDLSQLWPETGCPVLRKGCSAARFTTGALESGVINFHESLSPLVAVRGNMGLLFPCLLEIPVSWIEPPGVLV